MSSVRLVLALHNHQPVGNFDGVFEGAYQSSYLPFLDLLEGYPEIPFVLHTSGPLMEWLVDRHPEYVARVRALVDAGRVEILGGGFYEPILTMIPHRDRVGQIRTYSESLERHFGRKVRGIWIAERVWEQSLTTAIAEAGIEYTILDDFHFQRAGLTDDELLGHYLTEDQGGLLKVFPASESMRYLMPFREPHDSYEYLRRLADRRPGSTVVFADDGEKFGSWPDTYDHVYKNGWLRRFCDMIVGNKDWLAVSTLADAVDSSKPIGKIFLPDSSYREMTEWALPPAKLSEFEALVRDERHAHGSERRKPFLRAGGSWRNFKAKYPETDEMYARMLGISKRLDELGPGVDPGLKAIARTELYRGECNCPYWHGAFGGLYLPHLRSAIYRHLIAADQALDACEGKQGPRSSIEPGDFNLDSFEEFRIENDRLIAFVRPATGGHIYELDVRHSLTNVLATLDRRPESYHSAVDRAARGVERPGENSGESGRISLKQEGLDRLLVYDRTPRKSLVDHFLPIGSTIEDLIFCRDVEKGDFATGTYLASAERLGDGVGLRMERSGSADGHAIRIRKSIRMEPGSPTIGVSYVLDGLPEGTPIRFAVEFNVASMAGHADDRYYSDMSGSRLGLLDTRLDRDATEGIALTDEWLDLSVSLRWDRPASLWCFPIETVSQSEGGFEGVYQGSAVIPHWTVVGDGSRCWELEVEWTLDHARRAISSGTA